MNKFFSCATVWGRKLDLIGPFLSKISVERVKLANKKELLSLDKLVGSGLVEVTPTREELEYVLRGGENSVLEFDQEGFITGQNKCFLVSLWFTARCYNLLFFYVYRKDGTKER